MATIPFSWLRAAYYNAAANALEEGGTIRSWWPRMIRDEIRYRKAQAGKRARTSRRRQPP